MTTPSFKRFLHIQKAYVYWALFYSAIVFGLCAFLLLTIGRIQTHALPTGSVELDIPYSKYLVGEEVTFSLKNNYNSSIYVMNNCPSEPLEVYKLVKNKWVRQHDTVDVAKCPLGKRQISIGPNDSVKGTFKPWKNLFRETGKYRIVAYVEYYNELPYADIEIVKAPDLVPIPKPKTIVQQAPTTILEQTQDNTSAAPQQPSSTGQGKTKTVNSGGGSITVSYTSSYITVVSISPRSGCSREGGGSGREVEVQFKCGEDEIQIHLELSNGKLYSQIEN